MSVKNDASGGVEDLFTFLYVKTQTCNCLVVKAVIRLRITVTSMP